MPALNALSTAQYDATRSYGDMVHLVHVYVIEPHPQAPTVSPYSGVVWTAAYSTLGQPVDYDGRVGNALATQPLLQGNQLLLVDDLTPGSANNPLWCSYGTCPNCAYLIRRDGTIAAVQTWVDVNAMRTAIDAVLAGN